MAEKMNDDEIKKIINEIDLGIPKYKQHGQYQMTLGSLIKALNKERPSLPLYIEFPDITFGSPGKPHSYYGYHSDLAFEPQTEPVTVGEFLKTCNECIRKSFLAPDGSPGFYRDYTMEISTPVWISTLDKASDLGITDVVSTSTDVTLKTEEIKEETDDW